MMANGVGGADADKLKALIVEFAPELEALGVKVDGFDGRLSALEKGVGGWTIWGSMYFDFFNQATEDVYLTPTPGAGDKPQTVKFKGVDYYKVKTKKHGNNFHRARLQIKRDLSDGVSFEARWNGKNRWDRWWVTAKDFLGAQGLQFRAGQFAIDFEGKDNLFANNAYWDDDANFLDQTYRGFELAYNRGAFSMVGFAASDSQAGGNDGIYKKTVGDEIYGARLAYNGEKFGVSANYLMFNGNGDELHDTNFKVYWAALAIKPLRGFNLTGAFYKEDIDSFEAIPGKDLPDDSPKMWKVVLDVDKSVLKFTNLRFEYAKYDQGFIIENQTGPMNWGSLDYNKGPMLLAGDTKLLKVSAIQNWGAKFSTFERYVQMDQDAFDSSVEAGKAKELQLGIAYQYSPNLQFIVDYAKLDGKVISGYVNPDYEDKVIRFRTFLSF